MVRLLQTPDPSSVFGPVCLNTVQVKAMRLLDGLVNRKTGEVEFIEARTGPWRGTRRRAGHGASTGGTPKTLLLKRP